MKDAEALAVIDSCAKAFPLPDEVSLEITGNVTSGLNPHLTTSASTIYLTGPLFRRIDVGGQVPMSLRIVKNHAFVVKANQVKIQEITQPFGAEITTCAQLDVLAKNGAAFLKDDGIVDIGGRRVRKLTLGELRQRDQSSMNKDYLISSFFFDSTSGALVNQSSMVPGRRSESEQILKVIAYSDVQDFDGTQFPGSIQESYSNVVLWNFKTSQIKTVARQGIAFFSR